MRVSKISVGIEWFGLLKGKDEGIEV